MSSVEVNGHEPKQAQRQPTIEDAIDSQITVPVAVFVNGVQASLGAFFPYDRLLVRLCHMLGGAIGVGVRGNLSAVLKLRAQCKEAFAAGLTAAPIAPPPQQQPAAPQQQV